MEARIFLKATLYCLLACWCGQVRPQISNSECRGVLDFYFVLDSSGSVAEEFHTEIVPFVRNVSNNFVSPNFRLAIITFGYTTVVHLPLTRAEGQDAIKAGIQSLLDLEPEGSTFLAPALQEVNSEIETLGGDAASVILVLTDGVLGDPSASDQQAELAHTRGARIFAIGVGGNVDRDQLGQIVDSEDNLYLGSNFQFLEEIYNNIVNKTCIEITTVIPDRVCLGSTEELTLSGRGFTTQLDQNRVACRFKFDDEFMLTHPSEPVQYKRMVCPVPELNYTGEMLLQVTLNGISFISSNASLISFTWCREVVEPSPPRTPPTPTSTSIPDHTTPTPTSTSFPDHTTPIPTSGHDEDLGYVAGIVVSLLVLLMLLALCGLWFFLPLITGKIVGGLPPEPREHDLEPKPPRKWETVDASYYGRGGAGGIAPVTVHWGNRGATEEGSKLTKSKDATMITIHEEPGRPAQRKPEPGCWDMTKRKVRRWYAVVSSYRPVRGESTRILCFPGPRVGEISSTQQNGTSSSLRSSHGTAMEPHTASTTGPHTIGMGPRTNSTTGTRQHTNNTTGVRPRSATITGVAMEPCSATVTGVAMGPHSATITGVAIGPRSATVTGVTMEPRSATVTGVTMEPRSATITGVAMGPRSATITGMRPRSASNTEMDPRSSSTGLGLCRMGQRTVSNSGAPSKPQPPRSSPNKPPPPSRSTHTPSRPPRPSSTLSSTTSTGTNDCTVNSGACSKPQPPRSSPNKPPPPSRSTHTPSRPPRPFSTPSSTTSSGTNHCIVDSGTCSKPQPPRSSPNKPPPPSRSTHTPSRPLPPSATPGTPPPKHA